MDYKDRVEEEISFLRKPEKSQKIATIAKLIAGRITKGWSFLGQPVEVHEKQVKEITDEVYRQLS